MVSHPFAEGAKGGISLRSVAEMATLDAGGTPCVRFRCGVQNSWIEGSGECSAGGDRAAGRPAGTAFFLVPVLGDVALEDRELRRAMARASLWQYARLAEQYPITDEEIDQEIDAVRTARLARQKNRQS